VNLDGYAIVRLTRDDGAELQRFLERGTDYYERFEGGPTPPNAAEIELTQLPRGYPADDLHVFAVRGERTIVALLNLFRNYPRHRQWWLGFLLVDPFLRGGGLGERLYRAAEIWIAAQGAEVVQLAVAEGNDDSQRFWRRMGFVENGRQPYRTIHGTGATVLMMTKPLGLAR
jgi:GNAT superfamily N-acetyltransferase